MNEKLTVEGELNKFCSNISISRNWAGVHCFTDYRESIEVGEKNALGLLKEQKLTYIEEFSMTVPLFDSSTITVSFFTSMLWGQGFPASTVCSKNVLK